MWVNKAEHDHLVSEFKRVRKELDEMKFAQKLRDVKEDNLEILEREKGIKRAAKRADNRRKREQEILDALHAQAVQGDVTAASLYFSRVDARMYDVNSVYPGRIVSGYPRSILFNNSH